jgi:hypothetical protein
MRARRVIYWSYDRISHLTTSIAVIVPILIAGLTGESEAKLAEFTSTATNQPHCHTRGEVRYGNLRACHQFIGETLNHKSCCPP